jgi:CheY-like chemotaxis protein
MPPPPIARLRHDPTGGRLAQVNILFVEDDAMNRRVVRDMLTVAGATMDEAPDAETGLRMIDEGDYDIVLMDLRMPGMDGLTAIGHIRARADEKATIPVIVVTADTALDICRDCIDQGADEVILKPVAMNKLFDAIGRLIARDNSRIMLN